MRSADALKVKAAVRDHAQDRRRRLCTACVAKGEHRHVIGHLYSELPCEACGAKPCHGAMVAG